MKKTAKYYAKNPKAKSKKNAYQKKYNAKPSERKRRSELVKENRKRGTYGNGDKKDVSHMKSGKTKLESQSKNRGRREKSRVKGSTRKKR